MATERRYTKPGTAIVTCEECGTEFTISWGQGYPPIDLQRLHPDHPQPNFTVKGDDPAANLEDVPPPEPAPAA